MAHISIPPRMDLKQDPLYEDTDFAMLDTHYYGGIKKYQWVTLPLALHGVICKKDGTTVTVNIGEKPEDPVFGVSDLLIHLAGEQMEKKASKVIEGEKGVFVAMPSRKSATGEYRDIAHPINSETRDYVQKIILEKYEEALQEA